MTETPAEQRLREVGAACEGVVDLTRAELAALDLGREALALLASFEVEAACVVTAELGAWKKRVSALLARARSVACATTDSLSLQRLAA